MYAAISRKLGAQSGFGLLVLRLGLGISYVLFGLPKLQKGPAMWTDIGHSMALLGIHFGTTYWGLLCALTETCGGVLIALGLFTRFVSVALCFNMIIATLVLHSASHYFDKWAFPAEMALIFFALIFIGPGRYSVDAKLGAA